MTGFTNQETIISGVYLYEARKVLRPGQVFHKKRTGQVIKHFILVNVFVVFLDTAPLSTEFANSSRIQTVFKAAIYSIKLKVEFVVLNQLIKIVGAKAGVFSLTGTNASSGGRAVHSRFTITSSVTSAAISDRSPAIRTMHLSHQALNSSFMRGRRRAFYGQ